MTKKSRPAGLVFLGSFTDTEDLAVSLVIDSDCHQHRDIGYLPGPGALQNDSVQVNIGEFTLYGPITPFFDLDVDLLVEVADGSGTDLGTPESLGDVFDTSY